MSGNNQLTIDFNDWVYDDKERREATSPSTIDTRTIALRQSMAQAPSPLFYISFGSGSSGNCCYLGTRNAGILIDAGILTETVVDTLKENGIKMENIVGICLTHDHGDHVKYAYNIVRKHKHMKVYCTNRVVNGMLRKHNISKRIKDYHSPSSRRYRSNLATLRLRHLMCLTTAMTTWASLSVTAIKTLW
jgi:mRNA degradation ribonuclease J1/J2